jgi:hypothetical protein
MFGNLGPLAKAYAEFEAFKKERREKTRDALIEVVKATREAWTNDPARAHFEIADKHLDAVLDAALPVTDIANRFGPDLLSFIAEKWKGLKK